MKLVLVHRRKSVQWILGLLYFSYRQTKRALLCLVYNPCKEIWL